jgi:hypothetical protein
MGCRLVLDRPSLDFAFTDILKAERLYALTTVPSRGHCTLRGIPSQRLDGPLEVRMVLANSSLQQLLDVSGAAHNRQTGILGKVRIGIREFTTIEY